MTLAASSRYQKYTPTVLTSTFAVPFPIFAAADLRVVVDGVDATAFSVTATFAGGRATDAQVVLAAAVSGVDVEIYGRRVPRRDNNYLRSSPNLADNLQFDADVLTAVQQEQKRDFERSLKVSAGIGVQPELASLSDGAALVYDDASKKIVPGPTVGEIAAAASHAASAAASASVAAMVRYDRPRPITDTDFGAACDGTTDDSAAVSAALNWAKSNNGAILVPRVARLASATVIAMAAEQHISVVGVGSRQSGFLVDNAVGGIDLDGSAVRSHSVRLSDIGFFPARSASGYPFKIRGLEGGSQDNRAAEIVDVHVGPVDDTVAFSFNEGPTISGLYRPLIDNLIVTQGAASTTKMAHILKTNGCYKPAFGRECYLKATAAAGGADYGLVSIGDVPEDVTIPPVTINGADIGYYLKNTGREPGGFICGVHINSKKKNIVIDGLKFATILAPQLYADTTEATFTDIEIINGDGIQILDPIYRGNSVNNRRHVSLAPAGGGVVRNIKVRAFGHYATVTQRPYYVGPGVNAVELELNRFLSGVDFASYPADLVEVDPTAANVIVRTASEFRQYDDGATAGPVMRYVRRSNSPAANDVIGQIDFVGMDSAAAEASIATMRAVLRDPVDGSEDGSLQLFASIAGVNTQAAAFEAVVANDQAAMLLLTNRGGTVSLQRVKVGASGSGGTGLRALCVDN